MKNRINSFHPILLGIFFFVFTQKSVAQELPDSLKNLTPNHIGFALDIFAFDLGLNLSARLSKDFSIGIEGEIGINFLDPISVKFTDLQNRDNLLGIFGGAFFITIHNIKSLKIDIGYRTETWVAGHKSDGGFFAEQFNGIYTKLFFKPQLKVTEKGLKYKPVLGVRFSVGSFNSFQDKYNALLFNLWIRIPLFHDQLYDISIKVSISNFNRHGSG